jgi:imidazoleglycerol-phosphate dehydratase
MRKTKETEIAVLLSIEGKGRCAIETPVDFFTHMLETLAKHSLCDLTLTARSDCALDQHHLVEDCGIALGMAFSKALGDRKGINRAGYFVFPMDDALAVCAVDIGGRSYLQFNARFRRRYCGGFETDLVEDFFYGFAQGLAANIAVRVLTGRSDHHKIEAVFKAFAKSMKMACSKDRRAIKDIPSTKGRLRL